MKLSAAQFADFVQWFSPRQARAPKRALMDEEARGKLIFTGPRVDPAPMMPRARILPRAGAKRRATSNVGVRSVSPAGIVFVDDGYWLDGEQFLLLIPERRSIRRPARAVLCTVAHWAPLNAGQFIISASFERLVGAFEPGIRDTLHHLPKP